MKSGREIKFRGKTLKDKRWVYGYGVLIMEKYAVIMHHTKRGIEERHVSLETVGQYIGIKDAEGKEIYEDDIIYFFFLNDPPVKGVIVFKNAVFVARTVDKRDLHLLGIGNHIKAGNIHDNPELMKKNET